MIQIKEIMDFIMRNNLIHNIEINNIIKHLIHNTRITIFLTRSFKINIFKNQYISIMNRNNHFRIFNKYKIFNKMDMILIKCKQILRIK